MDIRTKVISMLITIILILGGYFYIQHLKANIKERDETITKLNKDISTISEANASNIDVINKLRNDKKNSDKALADLERKRQEEAKKIEDILNSIRLSPDNTPPSKILKDTVERVLEGRKKP